MVLVSGFVAAKVAGVKILQPLAALIPFVPCLLFAGEPPSAGDIAQCVQTTKIVFNHKVDRDPKILAKYYTPQFRALVEKGVASEAGEVPFLDADFLRLTQDVSPKISKVGPGTCKAGRISVPVALQYGPGESNTNTAVFERVGDRWMIGDLVSSFGSLRADLEKQFGIRR